MKHESTLGPLWDTGPKTSGFRLAIPNPMELYTWAISQANTNGDYTQEQIELEIIRDVEDLITGKRQKFSSRSREWQTDINESLLESVNIEFDSGYSPSTGGYAELIARLDYRTHHKGLRTL